MTHKSNPFHLPGGSVRRKAYSSLLALLMVGPAMADDAPANFAATQNPIVLITGFAGSPNTAPNTPYWYGIESDLREHGATVYVPDLPTIQSDTGADGRGEKLIAYLRQKQQETGAQKFNLIGHSQGGLTARYVAYKAPELVVSVTTIGTPHHGTKLGDLLLDPANLDPTGTLLPLVESLINQLSPNVNLVAALKLLSNAEIRKFNTEIPSLGLGPEPQPGGSCATGAAQETVNGHEHRLYSWAGDAIQRQPPLNLPGDASTNGPFDPAIAKDPGMVVMRLLGSILITAFNAPANDGLVDVCSAKYGQVLGPYHWNHLDETNREKGVRGARAEDPVQVIRTHAHTLKTTGL